MQSHHVQRACSTAFELPAETHASEIVGSAERLSRNIEVNSSGPGVLEIVRLAAYGRVHDGTEPFTAEIGVDRPIAANDLLPDDAIVERTAQSALRIAVLARIPGATLTIETSGRHTKITISANTIERLNEISGQMRRQTSLPTLDNIVQARAWRRIRSIATANEIDLVTPDWDALERNYPASVRDALTRLHGIADPPTGGRLVLFHGDPGTGKTTAIRSLIGGWKRWATIEYLVDASDLFDPNFVQEVIASVPPESRYPTITRVSDPAKVWKVIVAEDCDGWLQRDGFGVRQSSLGQLLNLSDGVFGDGLNTIVIMTTNEPLAEIHPALTRPGRCLALIEFSRFSQSEARTWLADPTANLDGQSPTLADLLFRSGTFEPIKQTSPKFETGVYL